MKTQLTPGFYLHQEDFVDGVVGPFDSLIEVQNHLDYQKERGDSAVLRGIYPEHSPSLISLRDGGTLFTTPQEDKDLDSEAASKKA